MAAGGASSGVVGGAIVRIPGWCRRNADTGDYEPDGSPAGTEGTLGRCGETPRRAAWFLAVEAAGGERWWRGSSRTASC